MDLIPGFCNQCNARLVKVPDARDAMVREMQHCMNGHTQTRGPTRAERKEPVEQSTSSFLVPYTTGSRSPSQLPGRE